MTRSRSGRVTRRFLAVTVAALLAAALAASPSSAALQDEYEPGPCIVNASQQTPFVDVDAGRFYTNAVGWAYLNDITTGTDSSHFSPTDSVTRAQFATFLHRMVCEPAATSNAPFGDLVAGAFYEEAVDWLWSEKLTTGTTDTTYSPHAGLSRGQFATFLWRLVGQPSGAPPSGFVDVDPDRFYALAIDWLLWRDITTGTSATTFTPERIVTRAEAVTFLYRLNIKATGLIDPADLNLGFSEVLFGLNSPVGASVHPIDGSIYIVEQDGRLLRVPADGSGSPDWGAGAGVVLDINSSVISGGERGLLGVAVAPDGAHIYLSFSTPRAGSSMDCDGSSITPNHDSVIWEYALVGGVPDGAPGEVMRVPQPFDNHNGGHVTFGPDGALYTSFGDGGGGGDPCETGQDINTVLGSIVRIDPNGAGGYTSPAGNPYANSAGADEIYLTGVRNPWKFSFDRMTDDLWVADVGQSSREEITFLSASSGAGLGANLGWDVYEGTVPFELGTDPDIANHIGPVYEYQTGGAEGRSITGGFVYRGSEIIGLSGTYLWSDFINPELRGYNADFGGPISYGVDAPGAVVSTFIEDGDGELYAVSHNGTVSKIVDLG